MNGIQKVLLVVGLAAMAMTTFWAPYTYRGHWTLAPLVDGGSRDQYVTQGTLHAPLWATPTSSDVQMITTERGHDWVEDAQVDLAAGKLGLWWAAIAAVTCVGVILATSKQSPPPSDHSTDNARATRQHRAFQ